MTIEMQIAKLGLSVEDFARCVASLNEELFLKKLDSWSPRDIVAHLIGWNYYIIEGSKQIKRGELPFYDIDPVFLTCQLLTANCLPSLNKWYYTPDTTTSVKTRLGVRQEEYIQGSLATSDSLCQNLR